MQIYQSYLGGTITTIITVQAQVITNQDLVLEFMEETKDKPILTGNNIFKINKPYYLDM